MSEPAYYDFNAKKYFERTHRQVDPDAIEAFTRGLPRESKILDAGCGSGRDLRVFNRMGFAAEGVDASEALAGLARSYSGCPVRVVDLMMLTLPRESLDGIWAHRVFNHLPKHGCQRVMGAFFSALKPGGRFFVSMDHALEPTESEDRADHPEGPARNLYGYPETDFESLIRQSGFQILAQGKTSGRPDQVAWIAQRLGQAMETKQ